MQDIQNYFDQNKLVAVIRSGVVSPAEEMIKAAMAGGFRIFEISMLTPQVERLIEMFSRQKDVLVGAGAVTDGEMAWRAIRAGARFLSSPFTERDVITVAKNNDVFVIQGALTPTEVKNAQHMGADMIKIYPAATAGGPAYIKSVKAAFPSVKIVAAGGITLNDAFEYFKDAAAVCVGASLFEKPLVRSDNWERITEKARQFSNKLETLKVSR